MADTALIWRVWLGRYTEPAVIVVPTDASIDEVVRMGRLALDARFQDQVRPEHEEYDSAIWTDFAAAADVSKVERGEVVTLHPRLIEVPQAAA